MIVCCYRLFDSAVHKRYTEEKNWFNFVIFIVLLLFLFDPEVPVSNTGMELFLFC